MPRLAAWELLRSGSPTPLRDVERVCRRHGLDERDTRLVRRIVGCETRRRATLRAIAKTYAHGKLKPDLMAHLHVALVQLLFLDRVPDHATLSESADAVSRTLGQSKVRVTNGILRNVLRDRREGHSGNPRRDLVGRELHLERDVFRDPQDDALLWAEDAFSIPASMLKRWSKRHGRDGALELARGFLEEPALSLRVDGVERDVVASELEQLDVATQPADHPRILIAAPDAAHAALTSDAFLEGRLSVQGQHALRAAELVGASEGERVLDLCAAPGGKSAALALAGAHVVASDVSASRLEALTATCSRLGLEERIRLVVGDGTAALAPDARFDAVLVDAPCSNTGVLAARPAARWRFGPQHLSSLTALQETLMEDAARRVRPGGRLVWSTCSLEPEENEQRVKAFLRTHEDWRLDEELASLPGKPGSPVLDAGYAARLVHDA